MKFPGECAGQTDGESSVRTRSGPRGACQVHGGGPLSKVIAQRDATTAPRRLLRTIDAAGPPRDLLARAPHGGGNLSEPPRTKTGRQGPGLVRLRVRARPPPRAHPPIRPSGARNSTNAWRFMTVTHMPRHLAHCAMMRALACQTAA